MCFRGVVCLVFFFFKQKTAYEMRISDWSSDVCSSDLGVALEQRLLAKLRRDPHGRQPEGGFAGVGAGQIDLAAGRVHDQQPVRPQVAAPDLHLLDPQDGGVGAELQVLLDANLRQGRKRVGEGKGASVSIDLGWARTRKK